LGAGGGLSSEMLLPLLSSFGFLLGIYYGNKLEMLLVLSLSVNLRLLHGTTLRKA
jgi:hypothetical protein